ncbi:hypothetical protein SAMN05216267_101369 [Actinacidiphila rubida]|uniref:N-acetyltransferase domain-containing protein n=1 Tax=Actinacidiphila rubida TaxID=310780 RepID=A0A1H8KKU4_9ACTN|nr:hypothetical protein SAMN05216267_101369 [Actinacidiphila rubida]
MATRTSPFGAELSVRPYAVADELAVLDLVAADRLPGQPAVTAAMLAEALAGRSPVDGGWWAELEPPVTDVVHDAAGTLLGVVSRAVRPRDGAGFVLWLHCREAPSVAEALLAHVLRRLGERVVYAFAFASALTLGLEGLPAVHRRATRDALLDAGFTGRDRWRYMRRPLPAGPLPATGLPGAAHVAITAARSEDPPGNRLEVREDGELLAEATVGSTVEGTGVLWWIGAAPPARVRGLGLAMLGAALDLLTEVGAHEVILYVDDDAPSGDAERDRTAANGMYDRAGFTEIDRLHSFTRQA